MTTDWKPFGKPIHYGIIRLDDDREHVDPEGWVIAWRPHPDYGIGIQYLSPDGRTFDITPGDSIEFFA